MSEDISASRLHYVDDPWHRLPWVMSVALLIWVGLLWGFGFITGQMTERTESPNTIDAQIIEIQPAEKHVAIPKQAVKKAMPKSTPPQIPAAVQQPETPKAIQPQPIKKPVVQIPLPAVPAVSLPEANMPGNQTSSVPIQSRAKSETSMPSQMMGASISSPQFGAAYLNNPKPVYPPSAKRMGMEGTVMLKVFVSWEGSVIKIEVAHSSGYKILDNAALQAVKNWRFIPARRGETPIDEWVQVPIAFHLNK